MNLLSSEYKLTFLAFSDNRDCTCLDNSDITELQKNKSCQLTSIHRRPLSFLLTSLAKWWLTADL